MHYTCSVAAATPVIALAAAHLVLASCVGDRHSDMVEQERLSVRTWTAPPGASLRAGSGLRRNGHDAEAIWELAVPMTWLQYRNWLEAGVGRRYRLVGAGDSKLAFARVTTGDHFSVNLSALSPQPLIVRVTFTARPD